MLKNFLKPFNQKKIPYSRQSISKKDIRKVIKVLKSDFITQGPTIDEFTKKINLKVKSKYAIAVNSATSALHLTYKALGLKKGDFVWTSPNTFIATANAALYCGAEVDFVDIDSKTYNISIKKLKDKLKKADREKKLPKIVTCVHFAGQSCSMEEIFKLSKRYNFKIVEDASHAFGAKYKGEYIGNCYYSDVAIFSFHPVKIITTGEGGVAVTNNDEIANKISMLSSHGIVRNNQNNIIKEEIWNYYQSDLGFNYRITDIQAALGITQLERIDQFINKRREIAREYDNALKNLPIITPFQDKDSYSSFHLYPIRVSKKNTGKTQIEVYEFLRSRGILANIHYIPVYLHPFYKKLGFKEGYCKEAEKYFKETISLPIFPLLKKSELKFILNSLKEIISPNV